MKKIIVLMLLAVLLLGCTRAPTQQVKKEPLTVQIGGQNPQLQPPTPSPAPQSSVKEFSIEAKQFEFNPSTITVNKGDKVKLTITSIDVTHGFSLPDFNIVATLSPGNTVVKEFMADKVGSFVFQCSVYCGSGHSGMRGTLIVNP